MEWALKTTRIEIELLTDFNSIFNYENGIRSGITRVVCQYVEANKYMCNYDKTKKKFIE